MTKMTELPPAQRDLSEIYNMTPEEASQAVRDELYEICKRSGPITLAYSRVWYLWRTAEQAIAPPDTRLRLNLAQLVIIGTINAVFGFLLGAWLG